MSSLRQMQADPATDRGGTVGKALHVLDLVASAGRPIRYSELSSRCSFPRATLFRLLQGLTSQRMLSYDRERRTYTLGIRLVRLAHSAWKQSSLGVVARPELDAIAADVGETIHLGQMENGQVIYVDKRNAVQPVEMFSQAGKVGPAYCTGIGKAMLAFLEADDRDRAIRQQSFYAYTRNTITSSGDLARELQDVRSQGIAFDREEHEPGIICVACPILSERRVVGAVSVTSTVLRHDLDSLAAYRSRLVKAAKNIEELARDWQFPEPN